MNNDRNLICVQDKGAYQRWCVKALCQLLNNTSEGLRSWELKGYADVIKGILLHYADIYQTEDGKHVNIYWGFNQGNKEKYFGNVLLSRAARDLIMSNNWENGRDLKYNARIDRPNGVDGKKRSIHFEHITPKQQVFRNLIKQLSICGFVTEEDINKIVRHEKIVVITCAEKDFLDGARMRFDSEDINGCLECISKDLADEIMGMENKRADDNGIALLRMMRLQLKAHTMFCRYNDDTIITPENWDEALACSCI